MRMICGEKDNTETRLIIHEDDKRRRADEVRRKREKDHRRFNIKRIDYSHIDKFHLQKEQTDYVALNKITYCQKYSKNNV